MLTIMQGQGGSVCCWQDGKSVHPRQKSEWRVLKTLRIELLSNLGIPRPGTHRKELESADSRDAAVSSFTTAWSSTVKSYRASYAHQGLNQCTGEMWYPGECSLSIKKKEVVLMMDLKDIMLHETSQAQKDEDHPFTHMQSNHGIANIQKNRNYLGG